MLERLTSGIKGFDELSHGGLPAKRATLICGGPGSGKSLFGLTFAAHSARKVPAAFLSFEERVEDIIENARGVGLDLETQIAENNLVLQFWGPGDTPDTEIGDFNLQGLFLRLEMLLKQHQTKVIVFDTLEVLFSMFTNERVIRTELVRLFRWLKEREITLVITAEQGDRSLTRFGLEEYVSDCVVFLDNQFHRDIVTRKLRIVKYRGAAHETNWFPFLMNSTGIIVMPITSAKLDHNIVRGQLATGVSRLDEALNGGIRKKSTTLLTGNAGAGKTVLCGHVIQGVCQQNLKVAMFSFEESPDELLHNFAASGTTVEQFHDSGLFKIHSARPTLFGLETHLVEIYQVASTFEPDLIIMDPITGFDSVAEKEVVYAALIRLIDTLKRLDACILMTAQTERRSGAIGFGLSSVIDSWIHLARGKNKSKFNYTLRVIKARGLKHERLPIPFQISDSGIRFEEIGSE